MKEGIFVEDPRTCSGVRITCFVCWLLPTIETFYGFCCSWQNWKTRTASQKGIKFQTSCKLFHKRYVMVKHATVEHFPGKIVELCDCRIVKNQQTKQNKQSMFQSECSFAKWSTYSGNMMLGTDKVDVYEDLTTYSGNLHVQRRSHLASLHWGGQKNQLVRYCLTSTTHDCCQTRWTCRVPEYVVRSS